MAAASSRDSLLLFRYVLASFPSRSVPPGLPDRDASSCVRINVNILRTVVIVVDEIQIDRLISRDAHATSKTTDASLN